MSESNQEHTDLTTIAIAIQREHLAQDPINMARIWFDHKARCTLAENFSHYSYDRETIENYISSHLPSAKHTRVDATDHPSVLWKGLLALQQNWGKAVRVANTSHAHSINNILRDVPTWAALAANHYMRVILLGGMKAEWRDAYDLAHRYHVMTCFGVLFERAWIDHVLEIYDFCYIAENFIESERRRIQANESSGQPVAMRDADPQTRSMNALEIFTYNMQHKPRRALVECASLMATCGRLAIEKELVTKERSGKGIWYSNIDVTHRSEHMRNVTEWLLTQGFSRTASWLSFIDRDLTELYEDETTETQEDG